MAVLWHHLTSNVIHSDIFWFILSYYRKIYACVYNWSHTKLYFYMIQLNSNFELSKLLGLRFKRRAVMNGTRTLLSYLVVSLCIFMTYFLWTPFNQAATVNKLLDYVNLLEKINKWQDNASNPSWTINTKCLC